MDGVENPVSPSKHVFEVQIDLVRRSVYIFDGLVGDARRPSPARHQTVQFGEIGFRDWLAPVNQTFDSSHFVAETLPVVSGRKKRAINRTESTKKNKKQTT